MKENFRKSLVLAIGILVGVATGMFFVEGSKTSYSFATEYLSNMSQELTYEDGEQEKLNPLNYFNIQNDHGNFSESYNKKYRLLENTPKPKIGAESFLVGDIETGEILFSKNSRKSYPIASISKLFTTVVAEKVLGLNADIFVSESAINTYGEQGNLVFGENYKLMEMLYPLLLESSNDAAEAIAESYGRNLFIKEMNDKVKSLGLDDTSFIDPSGLSGGNVSSANDLFKFSKYLEANHQFIFNLTARKQYDGKKLWFNNSKFRSDKDYYGGKSGYTDLALKTQIAVFKINFDGEEKKIAFIVLKTDEMEEDIRAFKRFVEKYVRYE